MKQDYPMILRANVIKPLKDDDAQRDIGWAEGMLADGRPYRLECWAQYQITMITVFISVLGLEDYQQDDFVRLLEEGGLYRCLEDRQVSAFEFTDHAGNVFWSINAAIGDEETVYGSSEVPLNRFSYE